MKHCTTLVVAVAFAMSLHAQNNSPKFGQIDKQDLLMKECPIEKSAAAMILNDYGEYSFDIKGDDLVLEQNVWQRVKIFTDKGLNKADIKIYYRSANRYQQISDIAGFIYNLDDKGEVVKTPLPSENIIRKSETEATSSIVLTFPNVKPGSVFEYRYKSTKNTVRNIDAWVLQHDIPTASSTLIFEPLPIMTFAPHFTIWPNYSLVRTEKEGSIRTMNTSSSMLRFKPVQYTFTLNNIEAFKTEPYMSGPLNYVQRLEFELTHINDKPVYTSWQELARGLDDDFYFGDQLKKKIVIRELEDSLAHITNSWEKIKYIHQFVRTNFTWNDVEDFLSLNVKKINRERKGTTGDINLVLINLLQHHGLEAYPLLCTTNDHIPVNPLTPNLDQFNTLNAIVKEGSKWYILNGADRYNPTHLIPYNVMYTKALMLNGEEAPKWIDIWEPGMIEKNNVAYMATLTEDGMINGDAYITSGGYAKPPKVKSLESGNEKYIENYFKGPGLTIEEFKVKGADVDSLDLVQQFKFSYKINSSGDYYYFNTNMFTGMNSNPFVSDKRVSDVHFLYNRRISLNTRIVIPESFQVEELPKSIQLIMPDSSISFIRSYHQEDNVITLRQTLEFNRPLFSADEYPDFKVFYKKMYDMLNEQIVMKKKK